MMFPKKIIHFIMLDYNNFSGPDCPDTFWHLDDETLKVSLQYDNTELIMNILNVYGYLVMGFLVCFLVLTILLPFTG